MEEELPLQRDEEIVFPMDEPPNLLVKTKWQAVKSYLYNQN